MFSYLRVFCSVLFLLLWLCRVMKVWLKFLFFSVCSGCFVGLKVCVFMLIDCKVVSMLLLFISDIGCLVLWLFSSMVILFKDWVLMFRLIGVVVMLKFFGNVLLLSVVVCLLSWCLC